VTHLQPFRLSDSLTQRRAEKLSRMHSIAPESPVVEEVARPERGVGAAPSRPPTLCLKRQEAYHPTSLFPKNAIRSQSELSDDHFHGHGEDSRWHVEEMCPCSTHTLTWVSAESRAFGRIGRVAEGFEHIGEPFRLANP
jgi:hypothetical protein